MSLAYIFPDHTARKRHIAIGVEIGAAVIALLLIIWATSNYWHATPSEVVQTTPVVDPMDARRVILAQPNPVIDLTSEEIASRKKLIEQPNPTVKLTAEQVQARKSALENI